MEFCRFGNILDSKFWLWKVAELKMFIEFDLLKVAEEFLQSKCYLLKAVKLFIGLTKLLKIVSKSGGIYNLIDTFHRPQISLNIFWWTSRFTFYFVDTFFATNCISNWLSIKQAPLSTPPSTVRKFFNRKTFYVDSVSQPPGLDFFNRSGLFSPTVLFDSLWKSKDKEIVCHTSHIHLAGIFLEDFLCLYFLLHDLMENLAKISEIFLCILV